MHSSELAVERVISPPTISGTARLAVLRKVQSVRYEAYSRNLHERSHPIDEVASPPGC